jgi:hypothetical protein
VHRKKSKATALLLAAILGAAFAAHPAASGAAAKPSAVVTGKLLSASGGGPEKNVRLALCTYEAVPNTGGLLPGQKVPIMEKSNGPLAGVIWVGNRETVVILKKNSKLPTARSGADGVFVFKKIPPGKYVVSLAEGNPCYSFIEAAGAPVVVSVEAPDQTIDLGEVTIKNP